MRKLHLKDLNPAAAVEVIADQNVETSLRYTLPIPNWLNEKNEPKYEHRRFRVSKDGEGAHKWRYYFRNYIDDCDQGVKIDGSGIIIFVEPTPTQAKQLTKFVRSFEKPLSELTPDDVDKILDYSRFTIGIVDRYNDNVKNCSYGLHPAFPEEGYEPLFGPMLKQPYVSSVMYVPGAGSFIDGAAATPQQYKNGAFIFLPNVRKDDVADAIQRKLNGEVIIIKLVQPDVFSRSRTLADGRKIQISRLPHAVPLDDQRSNKIT